MDQFPSCSVLQKTRCLFQKNQAWSVSSEVNTDALKEPPDGYPVFDPGNKRNIWVERLTLLPH